MTDRGRYGAVLIAAAVSVLVAVLAADAADVASASPAKAAFKRGLGFWPSDFTPSYLDQCFQAMSPQADIVYVQRNDPFDRPENQGTNGTLDQWLDRATTAGKLKYLALEMFNGDRSALNLPADWQGPAPTLADATWRTEYSNHVVSVVQRNNPDYLNIAVEVNMYLKTHPEETQSFRAFFNALYGVLKGAYPKMKVFCSYQYEVLTGQFPGQSPTTQWDLLGANAVTQDLLGISSYPMYLRTPYSAAAVPSNYFQALQGRTTLPIFFAEMGWYSSNAVTPAGQPAVQATFIQNLPSLLQGLNVEAVCWVNFVDLKDVPPLAPLKQLAPQLFSFGLLDVNLRPKPAWTQWQNLGK